MAKTAFTNSVAALARHRRSKSPPITKTASTSRLAHLDGNDLESFSATSSAAVASSPHSSIADSLQPSNPRRAVDLADSEMALRLEEWQFCYHWHRPPSSLKGKMAMERSGEIIEQTPLNEDACQGYDAGHELIQERHYKVEIQLRKLKRC